MNAGPDSRTGWPPGLLQDDCKKLSRWFASRPDARFVVRQVCGQIVRYRVSDKGRVSMNAADALKTEKVQSDLAAVRRIREEKE